MDNVKLRDCFHINEFGAEYMQRVFLVFEKYEIDHIELGDHPDRYVKIVFGRSIPECTMSEARE